MKANKITTIASLVSILLFSNPTSIPNQQPMPKEVGIITKPPIIWYTPNIGYGVIPSKHGLNIRLDTDFDGIEETIFTHLNCNGADQTQAFAAYKILERILLLDNEPTDGIVDKVIKTDGNRQVYQDAPECVHFI